MGARELRLVQAGQGWVMSYGDHRLVSALGYFLLDAQEFLRGDVVQVVVYVQGVDIDVRRAEADGRVDNIEEAALVADYHHYSVVVVGDAQLGMGRLC